MIASIYDHYLIALLTVLVAPVQNTVPACNSHGSAPSPQPLNAYTSLGQELHSPSYPSQYPTHTICLWEIKATMGVVKVTFSSFDLEESVACSRDYLEAIDRSSGRDQSIGKYCGSVSPLVIYSSDSVLTLRFVTEGFGTDNKGFSLQYQAVSEENASVFCSASKANDRLQNVGSSGEIFSPNYPANYPDTIICTWALVVPDGKSVELEFLDFDLKDHSHKIDTCSDAEDYVEVRDGQSYMSPMKGRFCGDSIKNKILPEQISENRYMWVRFHASNRTSKTWRGFRAQFQAVDLNSIFDPSVCSPLAPDSVNNKLKLSGSSGTFSSPNFPSNYPPSISCTWVITVPLGKRVKLTFDAFSTETVHHSCDADSDYVEVRDGNFPHSATIKSSCGTQIPAPVHSRDRYLWVRFVSNSNSHTSGGFKAHFHAVDKESISEILIGVVVGCVFFVAMCICLVCCVKKRRNPRPRSARPPSDPRQRQQRQLLPKPEDEPHLLRNTTYPPHPVGYMPQPSVEIAGYPREPPPPYSEGVLPPYSGPNAPQRVQPHLWRQEDSPSFILSTNSTNF